MIRTRKSPLAWIVLGLLAALVATNVIFLLLVGPKGPLIGIIFYAGLLALMWGGQQQDWGAAMVGGGVGLAVHAIEIMTVGWSAYPGLMALNLILPGVLALVAWFASRQARREDSSE